MKLGGYGMKLIRRALLILVTLAGAAIAADAQQEPQVHIDKSGTAHLPALDVPLSSYMSEQAKEAFIKAALQPLDAEAWGKQPISKVRVLYDGALQKFLDRASVLYPVRIEERKVAGVSTRMITPKDGVPLDHRARVLLNLHGGGFFMGEGNEALLESIPIAGLGKYKVITVNYREGPEYRFPAASEDVASVYRELLKEYKSSDIGIYGCSAGGTLSAMAIAWFQREGLPAPGAIGIFGAGAFGSFYGAPATPGTWGGDSRFTAPPLVGDKPLPPGPNGAPSIPADMSAYLSNANLADPLVSPALSPTVLAKFPTTLLITGTRAYDMSAAIQTQRELTNAGVAADLHLWDGMGHCFFFDVDLPESQEAFSVITKFFNTHLGHPVK
jgi:monoterpene epsilon-lactone hydrolase